MNHQLSEYFICAILIIDYFLNFILAVSFVYLYCSLTMKSY